MKLRFSIALPTYKSLFLEECIQSILYQEYKNFELIILNDCSPNAIEPIIESFDDERIHYYKNERNTGAERLVDNWNKCLNLATGDYFMIMGDDDILEPDYLMEFAEIINKYPGLNVYHCRSRIIDEKGDTIGLTASWPEFESVYESMWHRMSRFRMQYISDFVYRTDYLKQSNGFYFLPYAWGSDDLTAYIATTGKGIAHINKPLFNYRTSRYTISTTGKIRVKIKAILQADEWLRQYLKNVPENENDKILYSQILNSRRKWLNRKIAYTISYFLLIECILNPIKRILKR